MENSVIAIQSYVITPLIVYPLLAPIFFEMDNNAFGEEVGEYFVVAIIANDNEDHQMMYNNQPVIEEDTKDCKSPCSSSAEMSIEICA